MLGRCWMRSGYAVGDHLLSSCEDADVFEREHGLATIPQVGKRIGGSDDLERYLSERGG